MSASSETALLEAPRTDSKPAKVETAAKPQPQIGKRDADAKPNPKPKQKKSKSSSAAACERYFLAHAKTESSGGPIAAGRELASEAEAMIEAFRAQVNFYVIREYRVTAKVTGTTPQLIKESIGSNR